MKKYFRYSLALVFAAVAMAGCEQEIDVKLKDATPRIVIEGWVTDDPGPYQFKISESGPYLGVGSESPITGAVAILHDDMGTVDTLVETRPGWYASGHLQGQMLHNYFLDVTVAGKTYHASNYLPRINPILATGYEYNDTIIFGKGYYVGLVAQEPVGVGDYYQFRFWRNDTAFNKVEDLFVTDDRYVDGQVSPFLFPYPCRLGDTVVVEVRSLSLSSYDFYVTLFQQGAGTGGPFASVPDNLNTNFDNGALGWFGASAARRDTIVIQ